jgi:predicted TPR repeat methyltransferase
MTEQPEGDRARLADAVAAHQAGDLAAAETGYRTILARDPDHPDALHWLGVMAMQVGETALAVELVGKAHALKPEDPLIAANLGNAHRAAGDWPSAEAAFLAATAISPGFADAWLRCAEAARELARPADARPRLERAAALRPDHARSWFLLGDVCRELDDVAAARVHWERALAADPTDRAGAAVALAAIGARPMPDRLDPAWIATLFDSYASQFDRHLTETLGYVGPAVFAEAVAAWRPVHGRRATLDLGCGTGLVGAAIAPLTTHLAGVDLSPEMVAEADRRGCYAELAVADLIAWTDGRQPSSADLVVAADVLNYLGDLEPALAAIHRALAPGGRLLISLERAPGDPAQGWDLGPALRFRHAVSYVTGLLGRLGFQAVATTPLTLRRQADAEVDSLLVSADRG